MTQPFIGEIQLFGFNFNPRGWAFANGGLSQPANSATRPARNSVV